MSVGDWILLGFTLALGWPWLVLGFEAFLSLWPTRHRAVDLNTRPACGVIIPAHNEAAGIAQTVQNVLAQTRPDDVVLVIADNCTDDTAAIARQHGARVTERQDAEKRGKGYALDHGFKTLPTELPVVVVVDADCELEPGAIDRLVCHATQSDRPVQGVYLIGTGKEAEPKRQLSAFAVLLKNKIRPLGLHRIGQPCLLTGTGMAFPRAVLQKAHLGSGNIVEDMKLGVDLALAGHPPLLVPDVHLRGAAAPNQAATMKQRTRWEHGHVATLLYGTPRLILKGLFTGRMGLVILGLELGVPPLSLLALSSLLFGLLCLIMWQLGSSVLPTVLMTTLLLNAMVMVFLSGIKHGRETISIKTIMMLPVYVAWKIPIYLKMLVARQQQWNRTERPPADSQTQA